MSIMESFETSLNSSCQTYSALASERPFDIDLGVVRDSFNYIREAWEKIKPDVKKYDDTIKENEKLKKLIDILINGTCCTCEFKDECTSTRYYYDEQQLPSCTLNEHIIKQLKDLGII